MAASDVLRIGTRGSPLALTQTGMVIEALKNAHRFLAEKGAVETVAIKTTGDKEQSQLLSTIGGKGLFTKELDEAMLAGNIDIAIHSMKDMPTFLPDGISLHAIMPREDVRDAFISNIAGTLDELPSNAVVGTASLRRQAQILNRRPDLRVVPIRGNIDTRLGKLNDGEVAATLLAYAGLRRLGKESAATSIIDTEFMLPAVGQGALAATCLTDDHRANTLLSSLAAPGVSAAILCERAMLAVLDGSCHTPIAGLAEVDDTGVLSLRGLIADPQGRQKVETMVSGPVAKAEQLGQKAAQELLLKAGPALIDAIKSEQVKIIRPYSEAEQEE